MRRRPPNLHAVISVPEAERAIYIDCEGFQDRSPTLLGILVDDVLDQVVLDHDLRLVADARGHRISTFQHEAVHLLDRCLLESRLIVGYSQHERNLLMAFAEVDLAGVYRDARMIASRWRNVMHPALPLNGRGLKDFLEFIGYPRGNHLGLKKSTRRIKAVLDMVKVKRSYDALTPVKKAQWTKLLEHNEIDCRGMQALVLRAARELADV